MTGTAFEERTGRMYYDLTLTNKEVHIMFANMVQDWFAWNDDYNDFIKALLHGDVKAMNLYMNRMTAEMFSYFDTGRSQKGEPERFYHGFVLGLIGFVRVTKRRRHGRSFIVMRNRKFD